MESSASEFGLSLFEVTILEEVDHFFVLFENAFGHYFFHIKLVIHAF